jgi:hypothetical protein
MGDGGLVYVEREDGSLETMRMVVGRGGVLGVVSITEEQEASASIDQGGKPPPLPKMKDLGIDQA